VPLKAVLSKGEQRRLALAMFLAEMEVISDPSPLIFDDPVSSIDQEGRRHIARTLLKLSETRQVIAFTHDLSFIYELDRLASSQLPVCVQQLQRRGKTVGHVSPDLPWRGLKAGQRVVTLHEELAAARKLYDEGVEEDYEKVAIDFCRHLREAFERVVEEEVLGDVVTRRNDTVRVLSLHKVTWSEEICDLVKKGTDETSPWVHDQPLADGAVPPNPDELSEGLELFKQLRAAIKVLRSESAKGASAGPSLKAVEHDPSDTDQAAPRQLRVVDPSPPAGEDAPAG
jgi:hypothetical protein